MCCPPGQLSLLSFSLIHNVQGSLCPHSRVKRRLPPLPPLPESKPRQRVGPVNKCNICDIILCTLEYWGHILYDVKPYLRIFDDIDKPIRPEQVLPLPLRTKESATLLRVFSICLIHRNKSYPTFLKSGIFSVLAQHAREAFHERAAAEYFLRIPGVWGSPNKWFVAMDSHKHCLPQLDNEKI